MGRIIMFRIATAFAALAVATSATAATPLVVFGDSLVDAGNAFLATGGAAANPAQGYVAGRFTNGFDFTDHVSSRLNGAPTVASLAGGSNFAVGGARAAGPASFGPFTAPSLPQQLGFYLASTGGTADPNALYVLNFGGNDVFAIASGNTGGLTGAQYAALSVANTLSAVTTLASLGATKILVMGNPVANGIGFGIESAQNAGLAALTLPNTKLYQYSYFGFYGRLLADPTSYNFPATTDFVGTCQSQRPVVAGKIDCTGIYSLDGTHPAKQAHYAIARDLTQVLGVPEPATWAMLIAGFGLVGAAARRRRPATAA
ncbi:PEPxxWA-CTERM sorting domain-containing protein [Sandaracinobacteroides saxicola]|uniref:SGNH/GDSL hydrolase family protein n=1 Tax=Sandaracinobacteroides saxicola TaxID=2759707 RepID=A0A7G5IHW3_9SPHN|nr:PEPxxWA-CTERM sorting domain-containing protein [Sandaracinobacteroides saxicola]QMW22955.1 SGNH/GDSL hydrolase family protein [Sandaracinobacteroides saxicola]